MDEKTKYYLVKIIAVAALIYSGILVFGSVAAFNVTQKLRSDFIATGNEHIYNGLNVIIFMFMVVGIMALIGSIGLFFFKKFGFYLALLSLVLVWVVSFLQNQGIAGNLPSVIIAAILFVCLIFLRKFVLEYPNQQSTSSNLSRI